MIPSQSSEIDRLVAELEQAEAYEQRLRQLIVDVRDQLAAGNQQAALSMLNAALSDIASIAQAIRKFPAIFITLARGASSPRRHVFCPSASNSGCTRSIA